MSIQLKLSINALTYSIEGCFYGFVHFGTSQLYRFYE